MAERLDVPEFQDNESYWRFHVARQAQSGLSVARYSAAEGFSPASLYNWRRRLAALAADTADQAPFPFVELTQMLTTTGVLPDVQSDIELLVPGGLRVRLPRGFCPDTLRRALEVLSSC